MKGRGDESFVLILFAPARQASQQYVLCYTDWYLKRCMPCLITVANKRLRFRMFYVCSVHLMLCEQAQKRTIIRIVNVKTLASNMC